MGALRAHSFQLNPNCLCEFEQISHFEQEVILCPQFLDLYNGNKNATPLSATSSPFPPNLLLFLLQPSAQMPF